MSDELAAFLRARYDEEACLAYEATHAGLGIDIGPDDKVISAVPEVHDHIATWHPARVLREVEAKRALVEDLLAEKHDVVDDCWYTCAAATEDRDGGETCDDNRQGGPCDCGRDARVARRLGFLALPYVEHPDYREEWKP